MILINLDLLTLSAARQTEMESLTAELIRKPPLERSAVVCVKFSKMVGVVRVSIEFFS
jgi:hypothetical protein